MKLLFLIQDITKNGGSERITLTLCNHLQKEGISCEIFSLFKENEKIFHKHEATPIIFSNKKNRILSIVQAIHYAKKYNRKLIIVSMGRLSVEVSFLSRLLRFKNFFCYEHVSFESFNFIIQKLKIVAYSMSKGVIFLTQHDTSIIRKYIKSKPVVTIENISPFAPLTTIDISNRENVVLAVGRLSFQKNFSRLIDLWTRTDCKDWKLIIIGSGPEESKLKEKLNLLKKDNIQLLSATNDIEYYYNQAKIFTMTSRYEGLPMVLIEAQSFGIPIISFDCKTGPAQIIDNGYSGFLIPYDNDSMYITSLEKLINDDSLLQRFSTNSLTNAEKFTFDKIKNKWLKLLEG